MAQLSFSASVAWQIAAHEAAAGNHPLIEADHLLLGIFSLEKIGLSGMADNLDAEAQRAIQAETSAVEDVLGAFELEATNLRRALRQSVGFGRSRSQDSVVHRSEACKQVFQRAEGLAEPGGEITCLHLLVAILEQPSPVLTAVLAESIPGVT